MEYIINVDDNYYIEVDKHFSTFDGELYVSVLVLIHSTTNAFKRICLVKCVHEHKWLDFILRTTWANRVLKAEKQLIKKARRQIAKLPSIVPALSEIK